MLLSRRPKPRVAISEIMGTLLLIGITLIAGAGVYGFVNSQTNTSAQQLGNSQNNNINYLREKESITLVNFDSNTGASNAISTYVYNNGAVTLAINVVTISGPTCPSGTPDCGDENRSILIIYNGLASTPWTCTGTYCTSATSPCFSQSASGLSSIPTQQLGRVTLTLTSCGFVFASSSSSPLKYSYTLNVQGRYGSSATTITTR